MPRSRRQIVSCALATALALAASSRVQAFSGGITSNNFSDPSLGCMNSGCHSGGVAPTVTLSGPTTVAPSSVNTYTLQFAQPDVAQTHGGLNVSVANGVLTVGGADSANTQTATNPVSMRDEITHTAPKMVASGNVTFTFQWTAPSAFTGVTLNGWGNAVNFGGTNAGDAASLATLSVSSTVPACAAAPLSGCKSSLKSGLQLKVDAADHSKDQIKWKWLKGDATTLGEFGNPTTTATYALCVYHNAGTLFGSYVVAPDAVLWEASGTKGFKYKDSLGSQGGVTQVKLSSGEAGSAKVQVKGKGLNLPDLPLSATVPTLPITVQLVNDDGTCWSSTFTSPPLKQDDSSFKAKEG